MSAYTIDARTVFHVTDDHVDRVAAELRILLEEFADLHAYEFHPPVTVEVSRRV